MAISESVCGSQGHRIESLKTGEKLITLPGSDPAKGTLLVPVYTVMCSACGLDLAEIKELDKKPPKRIRKPKDSAVTENA